MARTEITVEVAGINGLQPTQTNLIADGHSFKPHRDIHVRVNNGATAFTLTIPTSRTVDGLAVADKTISIGSNEEHVINFRDVDIANFIQSDGLIYLDYSNVSDGNVEVYR